MEESKERSRTWNTDTKRLLVVIFLTVLYPVFVSAFFALYVFILLPLMVRDYYGMMPNSNIVHQGGWYHMYWLAVTLFWGVLCAVILPCFTDKEKKTGEIIGMEVRHSPSFPTKAQKVQPFIQVEEGSGNQRFSVITDKSRGSSSSIEKGMVEEKAEKESLEKSKETLNKSSASLEERKRLTQSGEFLNDFIDSIDNEDLKKKEAECEVHAEQEDTKTSKETKEENNRNSQMNEGEDSDEDEDDTSKDGQGSKDADSRKNADNANPGDLEEDPSNQENKGKDKEKITQDNLDKKKQDQMPDDGIKAEVIEPIVEKEEEPLQVENAKIMEGEPSNETEEVKDMDDVGPMLRKKKNAVLSIDTSRASELYECSMPAPRTADSFKQELFLFVEPEEPVAPPDDEIVVILKSEEMKEK